MFWMRSTISIYKVWIIVKHQSTTENSQVSNLDLRFMKWWVKEEPSQAVNFRLNTEGKKAKSRETVTESRSLQIERNHSTLQDDFFPPYYSFHETPGDIVHTLLTAFTPLLFLCYPHSSLQHLSPGGNTQKSCICKGCQCWLLESQRALSCLAAWLVQVASTGQWAFLTHQAVLRYLTPGCCTTQGTCGLLTALS